MIFYMTDFNVIDSCNVHECIINFLHAVLVSMCLLCAIKEIIYCVNGHLLILWKELKHYKQSFGFVFYFDEIKFLDS